MKGTRIQHVDPEDFRGRLASYLGSDEYKEIQDKSLNEFMESDFYKETKETAINVALQNLNRFIFDNLATADLAVDEEDKKEINIHRLANRLNEEGPGLHKVVKATDILEDTSECGDLPYSNAALDFLTSLESDEDFETLNLISKVIRLFKEAYLDTIGFEKTDKVLISYENGDLYVVLRK